MGRDRTPAIDDDSDLPPGRREPVLGDPGALRFGTSPRRRAARYDRAQRGPPAAGGRGWLPWCAGAVVLALVVAAVAFRQPLADRLWPQARAQSLSEQAAQALARGHLTAADGSGARELYEASMAIDPDRLEPRAGLARVAEAALRQARLAAEANRFAEAHAALRMARELSAPRAAADPVAEDLRRRESDHAGIAGLVRAAEAARTAGRLDGDAAAALPLYARVLELEPRDAAALRGREDALSAMLERARAQLRAGEVQAAAAAIAAARRYDAGHVDLPDTQARFTEELDALRRRADADLRAGRIKRAVERWRSLQQFDPADAAAGQGLQQAAVAYAALAQRAAADFRFDAADNALAQARALAPEHAEVTAARDRVERARRNHAQLRTRAADGRAGAGVAELLAQAEAAEARGDLMAPPGDSAYDKLRAAQARAPRDPAVRRAADRLLPAARSCFDRALSANDLGRARACFDARATLGDDTPALAQARTRLAQRWLAIGDERLAAGQLGPARAALASAQDLDPGVPGLLELRERLRVAAPDQGAN